MAAFANRQIYFSFIKLNEHCNKMIKVMKKSYNVPDGITMDVTDLTESSNPEEITNKFVEATKRNIIDSIRKAKNVMIEKAEAEKASKIAALKLIRAQSVAPVQAPFQKLLCAVQNNVLEKIVLKGTATSLQ